MKVKVILSGSEGRTYTYRDMNEEQLKELIDLARDLNNSSSGYDPDMRLKEKMSEKWLVNPHPDKELDLERLDELGVERDAD